MEISAASAEYVTFFFVNFLLWVGVPAALCAVLLFLSHDDTRKDGEK